MFSSDSGYLETLVLKMYQVKGSVACAQISPDGSSLAEADAAPAGHTPRLSFPVLSVYHRSPVFARLLTAILLWPHTAAVS